MSESRAVARAIDALRRGWPVAVGEIAFLAVETASAETLAAFDGGGAPADLLISGPRAATLKLTNQREAVPSRRAAWLDLDEARAVADPALDLAFPLKGPFQTAALCSPPTAEAALKVGTQLKAKYPVIRVTIYDAAEKTRTLVDAATAPAAT